MAAAFAFAALQISPAWPFPYADFLEPANPQHLSLTLLAGGHGNGNQHGSTHEGFELEQTITAYIGLVGRVAIYQNYHGLSYETPLLESAAGIPRHFAVLEGGLALEPVQGTTVMILGGQDVGDSKAPRIEGDLSSWLLLHSQHPINVSLAVNHYYQNDLTAETIDIRTVMLSTGELMILAGAGAEIWHGGPEPHPRLQLGPDFGVFIPKWHAGLDMQIGYGSADVYGLVGLWRHLGWDEE